MSNISLPNSIAGGQTMDPRPIQANFDEVERFINADVFLADGTRPLTGNLTLPGPGTAASHAVQKSQLDNAIAGVQLSDATANAVATAATYTDAAKADAISTAASYTDAAKANAISTAASDATTKANAALAAAQAYHNSNTPAASAGVELRFAQDLVGTTRTTSTTAQSFLVTPSFTNTKSGYYIITASVDVKIKTVGGYGDVDAFAADLYVDGIVNPSAMVWDLSPNANVGARITLSKVWIVANPADTVSFELKVRQVSSGSGGSYEADGANHSFLQALFVG